MFYIPSPYPLRNVTEQDLKGLVEVLWNWDLCESCEIEPGKQPCSLQPCPGIRWNKMRPFFDYYGKLTTDYVPDIIAGTPAALQSHTELFAIIRLLKQNPDKMRSELRTEHYANPNADQLPTISDQNRAFDLALRVMTMVTCSLEATPTYTLEAGLRPRPWKEDQSWTQFIATAFPTAEYAGVGTHDEGAATSRQINERVTARRLLKVARLRFVPTNELGNHLKLNQKEGTVELYHHTSFLKENLIASQNDIRSVSAQHLNTFAYYSRGSSGYIPRQIATEVLNSIQRTLFPSTTDAKILLRSLVAKHKLDPDCLTFEPSAYQLPGENTTGYRFLESRLVDLYEELDNPTPRGYLEKWLERRSGARYVMMATLGGVAIAILLGALALAVSIFQAWVGWQQWQHPVGG